MRLPTLSLVGLAATHVAATWPAESDWTPILVDGAPVEDVCDDTTDTSATDLIGDAAAPVGYWFDDGAELWFRIRLADRAHTGGRRWRDAAWGVMLSADPVGQCGYDVALVLDGAASEVRLVADVDGGSPVEIDATEDVIGAWPAGAWPSGWAVAGAASYTSASSRVCGNGARDWYLELHVPWKALESAGIWSTDGLRMVPGTWAPGTDFSADVAACDGTTSACECLP